MGRRITQAVIIMVPTAMHIMHDPTGATGIGHTDTGTTVEKSALDVRRDTSRARPPEEPVIKWPAVGSPAKNRSKQFAQIGPARERLAAL
jgi:hypothetical protein